MDVIVSPQIPTSERVRSLQRSLAHALRHNSLWLAVDDRPWELVAIIVSGRTNEELFVDFALRSSEDHRLRALVGATPDGRPVAIETILDSAKDDYMDPDLFLGIATRASECIAEAQGSHAPNSVH